MFSVSQDVCKLKKDFSNLSEKRKIANQRSALSENPRKLTEKTEEEGMPRYTGQYDKISFMRQKKAGD